MSEFFQSDKQLLIESFKNFLKQTDEFKDYNFEGSAINSIISQLAYAFQHWAFYNNMTSNNLFLSSASLDSSVHKLANMLNYLPKRKVSPYITVNVENPTGTDVILPQRTVFQIGDIQLLNLEEYNIPANSNINIKLNEGNWRTIVFDSDGSFFQRFMLIDKQYIDNDNLFVYHNVIQPDGSFILDNTPLNMLNENAIISGNKSYYLEYLDEMYVKFDNGTITVPLSTGDQVIVQYLYTNGALYNTFTGDITTSYISPLIYSTTDILKNGLDEESIDNIKINAPLFYVTNNRAVTEEDYNSILRKYSNFSSFFSAVAWGGEKEYIDLDGNIVHSTFGTPDKGFVYLSAIKSDFQYLTVDEINSLKEFLDKYRIVSIFYRFKHPNILKFTPIIKVKLVDYFNITLTEIKNLINTNFLDLLKGYNKTLKLSNLTKYIDNITDVDYCTVDYTTSCIVKGSENISIRLGNEVKQNSISANTNLGTLYDDPVNTQQGYLKIGSNNVGTIWYLTGELFITTELNDFTMNFEYFDKSKFSLKKETMFDYNDYTVQILQ